MDYDQFKGSIVEKEQILTPRQPFEVISKLGVRYTGIFDHISQEDSTICLSQGQELKIVYNHGTEDRPTPKRINGSETSLGWVRFHTESIEKIAVVQSHLPPALAPPAEILDPIVASVSYAAPPTAGVPPGARPPPGLGRRPSGGAPPQGSSSRPPYELPRRPSSNADNGPSSINTAMDRVQASLADLSVNGGQQQQQQQHRQRRPPHQHPHQPRAPIEVPNTPFDFSTGTNALEAEREARRGKGGEEDDEDESGNLADVEGEPAPRPEAGAVSPPVDGGEEKEKPSTAYKKSSFFDGLSAESSRVSRAEERGRNYDTFGEAGGSNQMGGGFRGGRGGFGQGGRGGYGRGGGGGYGQGQGQGRGGYHQGQQSGYGGYGYGQREGGGGYRGRGHSRGGYGGYGQQQQQQ